MAAERSANKPLKIRRVWARMARLWPLWTRCVPMKIVVNNCRTSLDVVTFRGVPEENFVEHYVKDFQLLDGSIDDWKSRTDAALLGETLANRRGLKVGDRFDAAGVTVYVAGVARSHEPQDQNVAYVHLPFLQRAKELKGKGLSRALIRVQMMRLIDHDRVPRIGRKKPATFRASVCNFPAQRVDRRDHHVCRIPEIHSRCINGAIVDLQADIEHLPQAFLPLGH